YGVSLLQVQPELAYGGAVRADDHYVYMPGQQQQVAQQNAAAPMHRSRSGAQDITLFRGGVPGMPAPQRGMEPRAAFKPQTSAIVCPMGMRSHSAEPTVPMLPSGTTGEGGAQRMRVWVPR